MSYLKITADITLYEHWKKEKNETKSIQVKTHWNLTDKVVVLVVDGKEYPVGKKDLINAVDGVTYSKYF